MVIIASMKTNPRVKQEEDGHHRGHEDQSKSKTRRRWYHRGHEDQSKSKTRERWSSSWP
ncbi:MULTISPECIES: hypothetical protein [Bacillaceae]|uniref:hypothetical protein n=1 Tax=Bacillaceae TaxID=186817 RepID=UPI00159B8C77|nr:MULTISPECIES: hypothetical protein [Bacillaceae]UGB30742.1 hypothetical protein LPC09_24095 [Metabacillus sp. B2-18]